MAEFRKDGHFTNEELEMFNRVSRREDLVTLSFYLITGGLVFYWIKSKYGRHEKDKKKEGS